MIGTPEERFWAKVEKTETCWLWTASRSTGSYGRFTNGGHVYAHRFVYELLIGPIPDGLTLDHLCRVRHCVNPAHLEPVTIRENILRGETRAAANVAKTHCLRGHLLAGANLTKAKGRRSCRTCMNAHGRAQYTREDRAHRNAVWRAWWRRRRETLAARAAGAAFFDLLDGGPYA